MSSATTSVVTLYQGLFTSCVFGERLVSVFLLWFLAVVAGGTKKDGELLALNGEKKKNEKMGSDLILALQELDRTATIDGGVALLLFGQ